VVHRYWPTGGPILVANDSLPTPAQVGSTGVGSGPRVWSRDLGFPAVRHGSVRDGNFVKRCFRETKRRTKVIGRFALTMTPTGTRPQQDPRPNCRRSPPQLTTSARQIPERSCRSPVSRSRARARRWRTRTRPAVGRVQRKDQCRDCVSGACSPVAGADNGAGNPRCSSDPPIKGYQRYRQDLCESHVWRIVAR
jgi:hypothetical protein